MMARLLERGRMLGDRRAQAVRDDVAALLGKVPGVEVSVEDDDVIVAGRGVRWRAIGEPALRWIGSMLR
jgi:hypothetical protein